MREPEATVHNLAIMIARRVCRNAIEQLHFSDLTYNVAQLIEGTYKCFWMRDFNAAFGRRTWDVSAQDMVAAFDESREILKETLDKMFGNDEWTGGVILTALQNLRFALALELEGYENPLNTDCRTFKINPGSKYWDGEKVADYTGDDVFYDVGPDNEDRGMYRVVTFTGPYSHYYISAWVEGDGLFFDDEGVPVHMQPFKE